MKNVSIPKNNSNKSYNKFSLFFFTLYRVLCCAVVGGNFVPAGKYSDTARKRRKGRRYTVVSSSNEYGL
jgi:hypothetical protein